MFITLKTIVTLTQNVFYKNQNLFNSALHSWSDLFKTHL